MACARSRKPPNIVSSAATNCDRSCSTDAPMILVMAPVKTLNPTRHDLEVGLAAGLRGCQQDLDQPAVEEGRQPLGRVEEVQRRPGRRRVDDDQVVVAGRLELPELLHRHVLLRPGEGARTALGRRGWRGSPRPSPGSACVRTISSNVRFMSSIIASSAPADSSTPATRRGVLSSSVRPIDCASRRAGSMVRTTVRRPRSAAREGERGRGRRLADAARAAADDDLGGVDRRVDVGIAHSCQCPRSCSSSANR